MVTGLNWESNRNGTGLAAYSLPSPMKNRNKSKFDKRVFLISLQLSCHCLCITVVSIYEALCLKPLMMQLKGKDAIPALTT